MQLNCQNCGREIPADNIHLDNMLAKCAACNAVFSFADNIGGTPRQINIPTPQGIEVDNIRGELNITRRWFSWKYVAMAVFALFWNGFMIVWHAISLSGGVWFMSLFGLIHTGVGLWLIYYVLGGFLNSTRISIGLGGLQIRHGPIPFPGNKSVDVANIEQLYCKDRLHRGKNSQYYTYEVHLITKSGEHDKLLTGLDKEEHALYVEQEIERFLGIKNRPVQGALR